MSLWIPLVIIALIGLGALYFAIVVVKRARQNELKRRKIERDIELLKMKSKK
jgi:hypothetical protein